ncbi:MAG: DEAD/DEAH box helicase [Bacteroidetes bacterium]|nr:DEAD/DEAH box helicase [Bacteroidota bacterium]
MSSEQSPPETIGFNDLGLSENTQKTLQDVGYEAPSAIQAAIIPIMLEGKDVIGQAQTGTGKTAAFALPILEQLQGKAGKPACLVLVPTRELAIQVAEAFSRYAHRSKAFRVLPVYGGQEYGNQTRRLDSGVHVIVGTPGRVMDHLRRGTMDLSELKTLVLDEADEMLRMGFIDDVEWILTQTPPTRQVALFSATMPPAIRRIAKKHLNDPKEVTLELRTRTAASIRQRWLPVSGHQKLDALTRLLEAEDFDAALVFARTKQDTVELAERLSARGYNVSALNGDMAQRQRERTVEQLKDGRIDVVVATDVAARGLDVDRISHVINFDMPYDVEAYVHRIGRTGRAGRSGEAILMVKPREEHMLHSIERAVRQPMDLYKLPSPAALREKRVQDFRQRISDTLAEGGLEWHQKLVINLITESGLDAVDVAAALARMAMGEDTAADHQNEDYVQQERNARPSTDRGGRAERSTARDRSDSRDRNERPAREERPARAARETRETRGDRDERPARPAREAREPRADRDEAAPARKAKPKDIPSFEPYAPKASAKGEPKMSRYRVDVGSEHGVQAGNIVGALANEGGIPARYIGHIEIHNDYTLLDLPDEIPQKQLRVIKRIWVCERPLRVSKVGG